MQAILVSTVNRSGSRRFASLWLVFRMLVVAALASACGGTYEVAKVENVVRAAAIWKDRSEAGFSPHVCLEFSTAAHELLNRSAGLKVPVNSAGQAVDVSYSSSASLAQIYTVSDIMQFGHATLYRLCEAAGNGMLEKQQYAKLVDEVLKSVKGLLELQLTGTKIGALQQIKNAQFEIAALDQEIQRLEKSRSSTAATDREVLVQHREEAVKQYKKLLNDYEVTAIFAATDPLADLKRTYQEEIEALEQAIDKNTKEKKELEKDRSSKTPNTPPYLRLAELNSSLKTDVARKKDLEEAMDHLSKMVAP